MKRIVLAVGGVLMLLNGCGPTHYRNYLHPSYGEAEFDRDWYECRRESKTWVAVGMEGIDEKMARACLSARGWRPVKE